MSRSRKHVCAGGMAVCRSEAPDKRAWHKRFRLHTRLAIHHGTEPPLVCEVSDRWNMGKDGKGLYFASSYTRRWRTDELVERLMRK